MASTNKTTNYELSQFIETDRPAWLTDYNGDMRTLDTALKAVSDVASGASVSISELADRMSTAEGNISTNTNDIAALDARADALEAGAQSQAGTIAGIQTEQIAQNAGIEAATELGYNLARPYDSASTYAVGDYVLFQNTLYKCVTAIATGEAFDPTKWLAIKATDEIAAGGYTLPIASASTLGGVKVGSGLSIDAVTGVLSAANIIKLTNNNTTFTFTDTQSLITIANYYNSSTGQTNTSLTSSSYNCTLMSNDENYIIDCGKYAIMSLYMRISFDQITLHGKDIFKGSFKIIPNFTDFDIDNYTAFGGIQVTSQKPQEFVNFTMQHLPNETNKTKFIIENNYYYPYSPSQAFNRNDCDVRVNLILIKVS